MTEFLMMTLTPQIRKVTIKKSASHPSLIREPYIGFRNLVDQLETFMKLKVREKLKLQLLNIVQTTTSQIINIHDSDSE